MNKRTTLATAFVAAVVAAGSTGSASAAPTGAQSCGTLKSGGATWSVVAAGVPCKAAKPLVRKLAAKPHPALGTRLGTYLGLKCVEFASGRKREIACVSTDGRRSVYGVTPARK
jgi:hypothetical protein